MKEPTKRPISSEAYMPVGMFAGLIVGIFMDNIGLWLALGLSIGTALSFRKEKK